MIKAKFMALAILGLMYAGNSGSQAGVVDVAGEAPIVGIVHPDEAAPPELHAASVLGHYLSVMTGQALPVVKESQRQGLAGRVIHVGRTTVGDALVPPSGWGEETILIDTKTGEDIVLTGGSGTAVLFAVHRFLRDLGCRWPIALHMGGTGFESIPRGERIQVERRRLVSSPDFAMRGWTTMWSFSMLDAQIKGQYATDTNQILDWGIRNGLNSMGKPGILDQGEARGHGYVQVAGHTLIGLVPGNAPDPLHKQLFREHPEYFPLVDGKRVALFKDGRAAQVCMSNPAVIELAARGVMEQLSEHPGTLRYNVGHNDEPSYWCECPKCLALDAKGSKWRKNDTLDAYAPNELRSSSPMSDRIVWFVNKVAQIVEKEFPDVYISTYAYGSTVSPPLRWKPRKNVMIEYANAAVCYRHSISDSSCPQNKLWVDFIKGWLKFGNPVIIYDYEQGTTLRHPDTPAIWLSGLADYIRFTKENGVHGWTGEGGGTWVGSALWFNVKANLLWDADADLDGLITDFCDNYYESAGGTMKRYYKLLDASLSEGPGHADRSLDVMRPQILVRAGRLLEKAAGEALSPEARHHVREARVSFLALRISQLEQAGQKDAKAYRQYETAVQEARDLIRDGKAQMMISPQFLSQLSMVYRPPFKAMSGEVVEELPILWKFRTDPKDEGETSGWPLTKTFDGSWKDVRTDASWTEQQYPGNYHGVGWYALDLAVPRADEGRLWLLFGAIDGDAWFWLNGVEAGRTTASPGVAWDKPFGLDITEKVRRGSSNKLIVKVKKDMFAAGIWKPVKLMRAGIVTDDIANEDVD